MFGIYYLIVGGIIGASVGGIIDVFAETRIPRLYDRNSVRQILKHKDIGNYLQYESEYHTMMSDLGKLLKDGSNREIDEQIIRIKTASFFKDWDAYNIDRKLMSKILFEENNEKKRELLKTFYINVIP
jgi:hypothetical protein